MARRRLSSKYSNTAFNRGTFRQHLVQKKLKKKVFRSLFYIVSDKLYNLILHIYVGMFVVNHPCIVMQKRTFGPGNAVVSMAAVRT